MNLEIAQAGLLREEKRTEGPQTNWSPSEEK